jgi:formylglycine-generating enzyme required for sulfatase activity
MEWVSVAAPGNACDASVPGCPGSVAYSYQISKYEVTNAQYVEFLNAIAADDPNGLYNTGMGTGPYGGIARSGSAGSYSYSVVSGRAAMPVTYVTFYDSIRFANWMNNGQPVGAQGAATTEGGAYTITPAGITGNTITRNTLAAIVVPSDDEWYKAAYFAAATAVYFDYPAGSNAAIGCSAPTATANRANCNGAVGNFTEVGSYPGSPSPSGTQDQGGNAFEWTDSILQVDYRNFRGGDFTTSAAFAGANSELGLLPTLDSFTLGFRVASIPEPSTALLVFCGLAVLAARRRRSIQA